MSYEYDQEEEIDYGSEEEEREYDDELQYDIPLPEIPPPKRTPCEANIVVQKCKTLKYKNR